MAPTKVQKPKQQHARPQSSDEKWIPLFCDLLRKKENQIIWNKSLKIHRKLTMRNARFRAMASEITTALDNSIIVTIEDLKEKWEYLRDEYTRHRRLGPTGAPADDSESTQWKYGDMLSFMDTMELERPTITNVPKEYSPLTPQSNVGNSFEDVDQSPDESQRLDQSQIDHDYGNIMNDDRNSLTDDDPFMGYMEEQHAGPSHAGTKASGKNRKDPQNVNNVEARMLTILEKIAASDQNQSMNEPYGKMVVNVLDRITDADKSSEALRKLHQWCSEFT